MAKALIGHTGFVGGNLLKQTDFTHCYNRSNIASIDQQDYEMVVCAGVQAVKWWANQNAEADWQGIATLQKSLENLRTKSFVLISTVDVYEKSNSGEDERATLSPDGQPYGKHRLMLEQWVRTTFDNALIIRLPGLFGPGLKKNIIFDLLTNNQTQNINPATAFQWYDLTRLWSDIRIALDNRLDIVNLMPEAVSSKAIIDSFFPGAPVGPEKAGGLHYDIRTCHGPLFGGDTRYIMSAAKTLKAIGAFVENVRSGGVTIEQPMVKSA